MPDACGVCPPPVVAASPNPKNAAEGAWQHYAVAQVGLRDVAEAKRNIDALQCALSTPGCSSTRQPHPSTTLSDVPQYDRTHVQGCVCKPAIAGGACCPSNIGNMGLQQLVSPKQSTSHAQTPAHVGLTALSGLSVILGIAGLYSGIQVLRGVQDAERNLRAVDNDAQERDHALGLARQRLRAFPQLPALHASLSRAQTAVHQMRRDIAISSDEQRFHRWVPGRLQIVAALGVIASSGHHLLSAGHTLVHGVMAGVAVNLLFIAYGGAMAGKNLLAWARARSLMQAQDPIDDDALAYLRDARAYADARRTQLLQTGAAWLGVSAAGLLGAAVSVGTVVLPQVGALTGVLTLVAGLGAMWSNSCSRYAPHLPVSTHMQRDAIVDVGQRATLYARLQKQQDAIVQALAQQSRNLSGLTQIRSALEQIFAPQCGSDAFMVLPKVIAARAHAQDAQVQAAQDRRAQQQAVLAYLKVEREIIQERLQAQHGLLAARQAELTAVLAPTCPSKRRTALGQAQTPSVAQDTLELAASMLAAETRDSVRQAPQLALVDGLIGRCQALCGPSSTAKTPADTKDRQRAWLQLRLEVMQLCGILRDGLSKTFIQTHGAELKRFRAAHMLPLGHIYPMPEAHEALIGAAAADMDTLFVHAFFNPRRIESEMDYLLAMHAFDASAPSGLPVSQSQPYVAAAASSATCCSG